eukprot:20337-Alexandrium_andersonii.AAC.1
MSASLVGSEMCIRDRCCPQRFCGLGANAPVQRRAEETQSGQSVRQTWPVSYTHLTLPTICSV